MARARFIRPEFFTDEKIGELHFGARLLFQAIWCHADLRGVFECSVKQLRVHAFPFDEGVTSEKVGEWLEELENANLLVRYVINGKAFGQVTNWSRHQQVTVREVEIGSHRIPPLDWVDPPEWAVIVEKAKNAKRIAKGSPWNDSITKPEPFQNTTLTHSPPPTPTVAESDESPPALSDKKINFIKSLGAKVNKGNEDLLPEWNAVLKGLKPDYITKIFKEAKPGILWPSEFKAHRISRSNY